VSQPPAVTFIVPVRNDAVRLRRCLESIRRAAASETVPVIVGDNGSTDDSAAVAAAEGAMVLSLPQLRVSALRNRAAGRAATPLLAFVDADNEIHAGWVASAIQGLEVDRLTGAIGYPYDPPDSGNWVQRWYDALRVHPPGQTDTDWLGSGNLVVRADVFARLGGFDETLETCEDVDFCRRVRGLGLRLVADERLRSVHHGDPRTLKAVFLGEVWRGRDNLRVSLRPPRSWRTLASLLLPVAHLTAWFSLALGALLAIAGLRTQAAVLAAFGVPVVLGIVALRTARMLANRRPERWLDVARAGAVAASYEIARALALVMRVGHGRRRAADR
jgi:GT2 family glycosyltransferase